MIRFRLIYLMAFLAAASAGSAQESKGGGSMPPPRTGIWASYAGHFSTSEVRVGTDGRGSGGELDGWPEPISIMLDQSLAGGGWRGRFRTPGNVAGFHGQSHAVGWWRFRDDFIRAGEEALLLWQTLLGHYTPPVPFVFTGGAIDRVPNAAVDRHRACVRGIMMQAYDRLIAAAGENARRADNLRVQNERLDTSEGLGVRLAEPLLGMMSAPLAPAPDKSLERMISDVLPGPAEQAAEVRAHGRVYALTVDLLADPDARAPRICRQLVFVDHGKSVSDRCLITAVLDERDGWPFWISAVRSVEHENGSATRTRHVLARQKEVDIPVPANPCG